MTSAIVTANTILEYIKTETDTIGVAYSGGKDSFATMELCSKHFKKIHAYYLTRFYGLEIVDRMMNFAKKKWNVTPTIYPHFDLARLYNNSVLRPHRTQNKKLNYSMADIENDFREKTGVKYIAYGWRSNDSFTRSIIMRRTRGIDTDGKRVFPLRDFTRSQVYQYLRANKIPKPPTFGRKEQGGIDFHPDAIAWIKNKFPNDYKKIIQEFPYAALPEI